MSDLFLIIVWAVVMLAIAGFSIILGKRYSVAYPIAMMAVLITVANILANKIVLFGSIAVAGGTLVYSATFLITDLISELWGKQAAKTAVWAGFYGSIFMVIMLWIVVSWPSPDFAIESAEKFAEALALTPRVVLASLITYLIVQHHDVWAFYMKKGIYMAQLINTQTELIFVTSDGDENTLITIGVNNTKNLSGTSLSKQPSGFCGQKLAGRT